MRIFSGYQSCKENDHKKNEQKIHDTCFSMNDEGCLPIENKILKHFRNPDKII